MYSEAKLKKLGSHCSNAVASTGKSSSFAERVIYRSGFVDKHLFSKECVCGLLSVYKQVKPSLSFAAAVKNKEIDNHVTVHPSVLGPNSRGQQPMVLSSRMTARYGNSSRHIEVVKDSTDLSVKQGVSHMGRDVSAHVKCKGNESLIWGERFVQKNWFQPLFTEHIERCIESKCQTDVNARVGEESQEKLVPVGLTVKDGDINVEGKIVNPYCNYNNVVTRHHSQRWKTGVSTDSSGIPACKGTGMILGKTTGSRQSLSESLRERKLRGGMSSRYFFCFSGL